MGFFKSLAKIVTAPVRIPVKAITGKDPFKDFVGTVKAVPQGVANIITFPVTAATALAQGFVAGAAPVAVEPSAVSVPELAPAISVPQTFVPQTFGQPAGIAGGPAAFGRFSPFASSGGNPAWDFFQGSQARFPQSGVSQVQLPAGWQASGTSVRFLG